MKRSALRILALLSACFVSAFGHSSAREGSRTIVMKLQEGEGITQALERNGCSMDWLSAVIRISGIPPEQNLRRLPLGAEITVPLPCYREPGAEIAETSRLIMARDRLSARRERVNHVIALTEELDHERRKSAQLETRAQELEGKIASLRGELEKIGKAQGEAVALKDSQITDRDERLAALVAELSRITALRKNNFWLAGASVLLVFLVGAGMFVLGKRRGENGRENEVLLKGPRTATIMFNGAWYAFEFDTFSRTDPEGKPEMHYRCPLCKERMLLAHNLERHLRGAHEELSGVDETTRSRPVAVP